jgi:hypothetical protein
METSGSNSDIGDLHVDYDIARNTTNNFNKVPKLLTSHTGAPSFSLGTHLSPTIAMMKTATSPMRFQTMSPSNMGKTANSPFSVAGSQA